MAKSKREQTIEFRCCDEDCWELWEVYGRFSANGEFEPLSDEARVCPNCDEETGFPDDKEIELAND